VLRAEGLEKVTMRRLGAGARHRRGSWPSGPHFLALVEALLAALDDGLVPGDRAAWAVDLFLLLATAGAAEQSTRNESGAGHEEWDALTTAVQRVSPEEFPHLAAVRQHLLSGPGGARRTWAFEVLINGVLHTPRPRSG